MVTADDGNRHLGSDCSDGSVFLPVFRFKRLGQPSTPCDRFVPPQFTQGQVCSADLAISLELLTVNRSGATAEIGYAQMPLEVECSGFDVCSDTHCANGVRWGDGDVAPYPDDPHNAGLEDFGDCCVEDADLLEVLFNFGFVYDYNDPAQFKPGRGDVTCDGTVDDADLLIVLFNFGLGCL
ncbi:hypothetical protein HRbin15_01403 [bacterium HR15]|nr:hypothetical protein HRbin15_01403 [bacterium HR15]